MMTRILAFLVSVGVGIAAEVRYGTPQVVGQLAAPPKLETSGLAASRRNPGIFWTHDDSGGAAALYGVRADGAKAAVLRLRGVKNKDWEDVAAFERAGKSWLLVGDTGDNDAERGTVFLHLVEEPRLSDFGKGQELTIAPTQTLQVRYADGPRDCESVAVDAAGGAVYLLTKRDHPARLYRVELDGTGGNAISLARHIATVSSIPEPTASEQKVKSFLGRRRGQVCAMDFSADGSAAVVLTYGGVLLFSRIGDEPWAQAFAREPISLPPHNLIQAEAACFTLKGDAIYVAAERNRALLRYDRL